MTFDLCSFQIMTYYTPYRPFGSYENFDNLKGGKFITMFDACFDLGKFGSTSQLGM